MSVSPEILYAFTNSFQPVKRAWQQAAAFAIADTGISLAVATAVLHVSRLGDGMQQNKLAESVGVNPGAMLRTIDQAEKAGLAERRDVVGNRRVKVIYLLPDGHALAAKMETALAELRSLLLQDVTEPEIVAATNLIRLFETRINNYLQQT